MACERLELRLRGRVQGLGLRPWALREARARGLGGAVWNAPDGVGLALEGAPEAIADWLAALAGRPPGGLRLEALEQHRVAPRGERSFRILAGAEAPGLASPETPAAGVRVPWDVPLCDDCLRELFDPADRRHRHAFIHCCACGPRASVLHALPYDRARTSLAAFPLCADCRREYEDPADRRCHAQTLACPACGPRLAASRPASLRADAARPDASCSGGEAVTGDPVEAAADALRAGGIVALKGYGGYHLAVDARSEQAVARLRKRKGRPLRPFALLVPDLAAARQLAVLGAADEALLGGPERAVVIAPRRDAGCRAAGIASGVAPRTRDLGLLLPLAPLHHLLLFAPGTRPGRDAPRFPALVFTSGNRSGEPTESDDAGARARLGQIADLFLTHDRRVAEPSDDPVFRSAASGPIPIRLSRGTAPLVIPAPFCAGAPPGLALGGDLKCAPALSCGGEIQLAAHVGDLESERACDALEQRSRRLGALLGVAPRWVAHDLHPAYHATALARALALPAIPVQHHHAHAAACLVENGRFCEPALALVLDGTGFGTDGTLWGGELLRVDGPRFTRLAHLETLRLVGGDRAAREPWRAAAAWLARAFPDAPPPRLAWHARREPGSLEVLARAAERGLNASLCSSCGRLFDAAASLLDLCDHSSHEGEAAGALESLAAEAPHAATSETAPAGAERVIPAAELIRALACERARGEPPARSARRFHARLAARLAAAAVAHARAQRVTRVALSGGCFQNRLLLEEVGARLAAAGLEPLRHRRTPPNDGGLALGQAAVAAALLATGSRADPSARI